STRLLAAAKLVSSTAGRTGGVTPARRPPVFMAKSADWRIWRARQNMSGYNRSCSRANSSILLAAQCAAALSIMPASALSCWAQGVTAASYKEYAIWVSPSGGMNSRPNSQGSAAGRPPDRTADHVRARDLKSAKALGPTGVTITARPSRQDNRIMQVEHLRALGATTPPSRKYRRSRLSQPATIAPDRDRAATFRP